MGASYALTFTFGEKGPKGQLWRRVGRLGVCSVVGARVGTGSLSLRVLGEESWLGPAAPGEVMRATLVLSSANNAS